MFKKLVLALPLFFAPATWSQNIIQLPDSLYAAGDTIAWVKRVPAFCEGPAWEAATGSVYFTQQASNATPNWPIWRVRPGVDTGIVWYNTYQNNGLEFDAQGRLVSAQNGRLSRLRQATVGDSGVVDSTLVISGTNGVTFNQANDLTIGSKGGIYFTALGSAVYYLSPSRQLSIATTNITSTNGIEWLEEQRAVYVNSTSGGVYRFAIDSNSGALTNRTTFLTTTAMPSADGGTLDSHGNRYVGSYSQGQIRVFNASGDSIGRITLATPPGAYNNRAGIAGNAVNAVFGGADMKTLYITGDGGLYSIRLKIPGRPPAQDPTSIRPFKFRPVNRNPAGVFGEPRDLNGRLLPEAWDGPVLKSFPLPEHR